MQNTSSNKTIRNAMLLLTIPYLLITMLVGYILLTSSDNIKDIKNNVVKVVKKAEIISNFENISKIENTNPEAIILTGFFVDKNTIITASHGVNDKESIYEITDKFGNIYIGTLISKNLENDTALLKINDNFKYFTKFKYTKNLKIGEKVKSISFAFESQTVKNGVIKNIEGEKIYSDTLFEEGDSGSPLLNEKNEVIGINTEVDLNSGMGITRKLAISKK